MRTHIVTIFDKNRLGRAVAFRASLAEHAPACHVHFLCLDQESYEMTRQLGLKDTTPIRPEDLGDPELLAARTGRTNPEFASTCKPAFLFYTMKSGLVGPDDLLVFIDDDFYFYASLQPLFEKVHASGSIGITPHRFPARRASEESTKGRYNAGIVFFKNDAEALKCLGEWRQQCLDWCYLRYENGQIGDQGYLSDWPKKYKNVYEIPDKGVNLSTWNIENYTITRKGEEGFLVDGDQLICYHFHGLKIYFGRHDRVLAYPITVFHSGIYAPFLKALDDSYARLLSIDSAWRYGTVPRLNVLKRLKQTISRPKH